MHLSPSPPSFFWRNELLFHRSIEYYFKNHPQTDDVFVLSAHHAIYEGRADIFKVVWEELSVQHKNAYDFIFEKLAEYAIFDQLDIINHMASFPKKDLFPPPHHAIVLLGIISTTENWFDEEPVCTRKFYLSLPQNTQNEVVQHLSKVDPKMQVRALVLMEHLAPTCSEQTQHELLRMWQLYTQINKDILIGSDFPFMKALEEKKNLTDAVTFPKTAQLAKRM